MSTEQHEALKLAEAMGCFSATQRNSDNAAGRAATMLRQQHELIVQMAEALETCECAPDPVGADSGLSFDEEKIDLALAKAKEYLK